MITSFLENDRVTFYSLYERFDKLNIWNTNYENQMLIKLDLLNSNINKLLDDLSFYSNQIIDSLQDLSYISEQNNNALENQLKKIDSSIKSNTILTSINTYQTYKVNKNTKSLR
tara:strand:+ start:858 stop:1199 length:342 start_codon:yes stop_codon:yes gene_type:complete